VSADYGTSENLAHVIAMKVYRTEHTDTGSITHEHE
jgi:hypothetical protein